uniref:ZM domain-containing protein n=1 Tax=Parastrongyloides trichosuri TaxID=131310 RepID=A0A0N4ZMC1_PARTI
MKKNNLKQVSEAPKKDDLDELAKLNKNLLERSKGLKKDFKLVSSEIIKTDPEPVPELYKEQLREMLESRISSETATSPLTLNATAADRSGYVTDASSTNWQFNNSFSPRSVVSINGCTNKDTPSILKVKTNHVEKHYNRSNSSVTNSILTEVCTEPIVREFTETYSRIKVRNNNSSSVGKSNESGERIENLREHEIISSPAIRSPPSPPTDDKPRGIIKPVVTKPRVTETIKRIEETRRTEEVERRVQRKEKKHRSHRYHHNDHYMTEGHYNSGHRSSSMNRNGMLPIGYYPGQETYHRSSTTRRENSFNDSPYYQMNGGRYGGSLSDSLRRGEVKYNPNGDIRESSQQIYDSRGHRRNSNSGYGMHKSYSTKDVFKDSNGGYYGSYYRNGNAPQPFVEFPPTLPRRHPGEGAPIPPPHRSASQLGMESHYRPISKSHSYADWSGDQRLQQHNNNYAYGRRHDEEMSRLENEFRDSLLIPLQQNGGVVNDHEHRVEQIPGGYEEYSRSVKGNAGKRLNRDGVPTDFREQSQSYSFRREQAH